MSEQLLIHYGYKFGCLAACGVTLHITMLFTNNWDDVTCPDCLEVMEKVGGRELKKVPKSEEEED